MKGPRFEVYRARDGWRWRLIAANGRIVATGEAHDRKRDAVRAVQRITDIAITAADVPLEVTP